ncbi:auxilin-related protein 1-like isoform X2 [Phragmites australis]|uniref:auxilin-related protein 1-like isoform X2 n=1 Tax=Phragmites australis TaxID=29695 RepID=UPI002D7726C7|nr:auxilin-related protein 1-like isoform X2 [Phragmites australis]
MADPVLVDDLGLFRPPPASVYDDMFDSCFNRAAEAPEPSSAASSSSPSPRPPVFDKPIFDDDPDAADVDPFDAIPLFGGGVGGGGGEGEENFLGGLGSAAKPEGKREPEVAGFDDDLMPGLGGSARSTEPVREAETDQEAPGFDDDSVPGFGGSTKPAPQAEPEVVGFDDGVIPGFGGSTNHDDSAREDPITREESESISSSKMSVSMPEDPFVILGAMPKSGYSSFRLFSDHLDNIGMPAKSGNTKVDAPSNTSVVFQSSDIFAGFPKAMPSYSFTSEKKSDTTERRSVDNINSMSHCNQTAQEKPVQRASAEAHGNVLPVMNVFEPSVLHEVPGTTGFQTLNPFAMDMPDELPEENQYSKMPNDVWLTVSDIALVTQPTSVPPPSRPPPPLATKQPLTESVTSKTYPHLHNQGFHHSVSSANTSKTSQINELEDFFMAKPAKFANGHPQALNHEGKEQYSSTATVSFMDWAELRHSKGINQGAFDSMFTSSQYRQQEIDEKIEFCSHEMENINEEGRVENERRQREHEEEQRSAEMEREEELEREREKVRQREQEERKRCEKEREARQAVEKAIREARERAGAEARMQAERMARQRAERAAVQKVAAEARERAVVEAKERAAKAAAEAKERAAAEARERAEAESRESAAKAAAEAREKAAAESQEKAAAEARAKAERAAVEKAAAEARRRAERAVFERVAAEARQRAANEARERAAAEARARENKHRTATAQPDLESIFGMPSRSSSVSRSQTATTNPFDVQPQGSSGSGTVRTSSGSASPFAQPSSSNLMDDLSSIFGAPSSSAVFQELDGESEERRKARLERHQRTMERAAKALAEKNERDLQAQQEQEERHRIGETLDFEIKRWAAGKEGNLRALLSTLQYILWPQCGWRPISLTDLITAASVKKEYRKATLCIHPDKVQQKGANLQQKYIAEKVFDLLKEAWNKFNSEELF